VFDTDGLRQIREDAARAVGVPYGKAEASDVSLRIMADHARTITTLIADGVVPSNDGRGYVLRRVLRRAVRRAWQLGAKRELITPLLVQSATSTLGPALPELNEKKDVILSTVIREEERFRRTLQSGMELLEAEIASLGPEQTLSGSTAFKLHDTYGFPIELTTEIANERGVSIFHEGFEDEMGKQRKRARQAWKGGDEAASSEFYRAVLDETGLTSFVGYSQELGTARVLAIVRDGELVERADEGQKVEIFVDVTPFYAESGGQVGDTGSITTATGTIDVWDTKHALAGLHGHRSQVKTGYVAVGQDAELVIDSPRREKIRKSHTGTHVLHWALRRVLGEHARQAGSLVEPGRLRFDFSHHAAVGGSELVEIESLANARLIENGRVTTAVTSKEDAERQGALAFFGDKYGDRVRLVKIGQFSVELCGGTHTHTAGQVGPLVVTSESSIGSNIRRVEALTGETAYAQLSDWRGGLAEAGRLLRTSPNEVPERIKTLLARVGELEASLDSFRQRDRDNLATHLAGEADALGDARLVVSAQPSLNPEHLRLLALAVRSRFASGVVILGSDLGGKGSLVASVSSDLVARGISAADLIAGGAKLMGGGGSRDPELAQAGGPDGSKLARALETVLETATSALASISKR
jgi:alanyl-tRNA synthetase